MTSVPITYFEETKLEELKAKWYNNKTHSSKVVFGNEAYTITGVTEKSQYMFTSIPRAISPTFEEKLDKWDFVCLCHKINAIGGQVFGICLLVDNVNV